MNTNRTNEHKNAKQICQAQGLYKYLNISSRVTRIVTCPTATRPCIYKFNVLFRCEHLNWCKHNNLFVSFKGNLGGMFGLFLGMSLLTILEFLEFIFTRICCFLKGQATGQRRSLATVHADSWISAKNNCPYNNFICLKKSLNFSMHKAPILFVMVLLSGLQTSDGIIDNKHISTDQTDTIFLESFWSQYLKLSMWITWYTT